MKEKLWGGRFSKELNKEANDFNSSLAFDCKMYREDILGSIAHAKMLGECSIIPLDESVTIINALKQILDDIDNNKLQFDFELEDIHTQVERWLIDRIGEIGKKVHTGRSRNDQVALDLRMYLKNKVENIKSLILDLISTLVSIQKEHTKTYMSGYTHLQRAQVITFAHYLGAYVEMFKRDFDRLADAYKRIDVMPLGAGALACSTYNIDNKKTAETLNFKNVMLNSLDAVSDRDFVIEVESVLSIIMMHLSRFSEELILYSTSEFKFVEFDDEFTTGSSLMPQKKNPDILELIRGKTGRVYGNLFSILTVMKSLPLAYNKDMQEDKEGIFDSLDNVKNCLSILPNVLKTMKVNKENMLNSVNEGFLNATEVADYLVRKGMPFRDAHGVSGRLVVYSIKNNKNLSTLSIEEYKKESDLFEDDIYACITPEAQVSNKTMIGSPSESAIMEVIKINEEWIKSNSK
ncbi:argininosuccinate lyase [Brachyspira hampsonii]|uniref:Argininosuccinate lyase n=1 Tax=Brachyspira hampsonii TaxID=1287055 RepID=A0AAC9XK01_9SPIR|nr:argininosuccinate lyase [Brachyspira hampsonii]ASJ21150.1 argininosuccinate lyase [Brachyspira hampsonii]ELV05228.1 argininosuccinate lyase [Brachyspira hampsonii 30599]MBW5381623.1 argininosuccinate lyase [Brachyspira hampsonii]OEJ16763.1 argininosuccinate lyase [Brachyspira hampsonii]